MLWTAKLCFIRVITVLDNKSLRVFISNQLGAGVDKYQLLQSISVKWICAYKGPWKVSDWLNNKQLFLLVGFYDCYKASWHYDRINIEHQEGQYTVSLALPFVASVPGSQHLCARFVKPQLSGLSKRFCHPWWAYLWLESMIVPLGYTLRLC